MVFFLSFFVVGCTGTTANLNKISLGMTKSEVIQQIGRPDSVSAKDNAEYLIYYWGTPKQIFGDENNLPEYYIKLIDGKVDSYGRKGDFDSTKDPTLNLNINTTTK